MRKVIRKGGAGGGQRTFEKDQGKPTNLSSLLYRWETGQLPIHKDWAAPEKPGG